MSDGVLVDVERPLADEIDFLAAAAKPPRKKRSAPELKVQVAIVRALNLALPNGSVVFRVTNEQKPRAGATPGQRMRFHQARKRAGVAPGFPDLGAIVVGGPPLILFEVKAGRGRPDPRQEDLHHHLRTRCATPVFVVHGPDEAVDAIRSLGVIPRQSELDP